MEPAVSWVDLGLGVQRMLVQAWEKYDNHNWYMHEVPRVADTSRQRLILVPQFFFFKFFAYWDCLSVYKMALYINNIIT